MTHTRTAFDGTKPKTIDIERQTLTLHFVWIAFSGVGGNKLTPAALTVVVLFATTMTVFGHMI